MARGWESKAVADQIEEADGRSRDDELEQIRLTASAEVRARNEHLESLRLSRSRTLQQLERATNPAYREMLQRTLRALESEIDDTK